METVSLRAQTVLHGVVALCCQHQNMVVLIKECHATQSEPLN